MDCYHTRNAETRMYVCTRHIQRQHAGKELQTKRSEIVDCGSFVVDRGQGEETTGSVEGPPFCRERTGHADGYTALTAVSFSCRFDSGAICHRTVAAFALQFSVACVRACVNGRARVSRQRGGVSLHRVAIDRSIDLAEAGALQSRSFSAHGVYARTHLLAIRIHENSLRR